MKSRRKPLKNALKFLKANNEVKKNVFDSLC